MSEKTIRRTINVTVIAIVAAIIFVTIFAGFIIDYLWFSSVSYTGVFWKIFWAKIFYPTLFTVLGFAALAGNFWYVYRISRQNGGLPATANPFLNMEFGEYTESIRQLTSGGPKRLYLLSLGLAAVLAILTGLSAAPHWENFLKYFNSVPFGKPDPAFGHDIGFYVFSLPIYTYVRGWLMSLVVTTFLASAAIYFISGLIRISERTAVFSQPIKTHLYTLVGIGLLLKAWDYRLQMYDLLYSRNGAIFGAGYTDYNIQRLALWLMLLYMVGLALFVFSSIFSPKNRVLWLVIALVLAIPVVMVFQGLVPGLVQQMIVKPNELNKEERFINYNIAMTNEAYNLNNIVVKPFPADNSLTVESVKKNEDTINNIRLWDADPLLSTYKQIQSIRTYYTFYNVDVDRYQINGKPRQVMLAVRELERDKIPSKTWVNTRLTYTHGYGVVMNPVHSITPEGLPELFIKDIPPVSSIDVPVTNSAIYFGENLAGANVATPNSIQNNTDDYVIVNTGNPEFDYPTGDENKYVQYQGTGGIRMGSFFRRCLFAWGFRDLNILLTGSTSSDSRIMFRRNIQQRIQHIAPFLELDRDPYVVISDGRLFWMQDAYTMSNQYPYSEPLPNRQRPKFNYIRNSVKIIVDAYTGSVDFYLADETDPIIKTYQNIFPNMFKNLSEMPADLRLHIRYPKDLFYIQMRQYNMYHMKDPKVFYNKEDLWTFPNETLGGETVPMEPYYTIMRIPGEQNLEFILLNPVTPNNKDNMIAWFAARSDGEHYGELMVYKFPKDKLVYGPSQIEARIDQDTLISQQFSLWDQRGSSVIRGNLLVIPIENSLVYVEPVYLKAAKRELPELKRVIASYAGNVVMENDLQSAIAKAFGGKLTVAEQQIVGQAPAAGIVEEATLQATIKQLTDHFGAARKSLAEGDWITYGEEMKKAEETIQQLQQQYGDTK